MDRKKRNLFVRNVDGREFCVENEEKSFPKGLEKKEKILRIKTTNQ